MSDRDFKITTKASQHDDGGNDKHENVHEHDEENPPRRISYKEIPAYALLGEYAEKYVHY